MISEGYHASKTGISSVMIILKWILKNGWGVWDGFIWLRIGTSCGIL
jgi:hypothetical protein